MPGCRVNVTKSFAQARTRGFTLVELLVVMVIIGILIALLLPVIGMARATVQEGTMTTEVATLSQSLEAFKTQYQAGYPPDFSGPITINGPRVMVQADPVTLDQFLGRLFRYRNALTDVPRNAAGQPLAEGRRLYEMLDPAEALWLWLRGFSSDPANPIWGPVGTAPDLVERVPLFEFDKARLGNRDGDAFLEYYPKYAKDHPFIYFVNTSYIGAFQFEPLNCLVGVDVKAVQPCPRPYLARINAADVLDPERVQSFAEPEKYQIICAGLDNDFGLQAIHTANTIGLYAFPFGPYPDKLHQDNITNFASGPLGKAVP